MGTDRALNVVALQTLLMSGMRTYRAQAGVAAHTHRIMATAASLDYVLMLATGSAGTRIPTDDAQRAIREGLARAVDDALLLLRAIVDSGDPAGTAFAHDGMPTIRAAIESETLIDDERSFALIALAADLSA